MAIENLKLYNHIKDKLFNSIGIDSKVFEEETFQKEIEKLNPDYLPKKHINSIKQYLKIYNDFLKTQNISINLRYYQVLAIVFTQYYLFEKDDSKLQEFSNSSLAYWMATGSGKTIIMYINILQYIKKIKNFEQLEIILTTPQTNLIEQHKKEIIPFIEYLNQIYNNKIKLIIETTQSLLFKVRQEKNYFDVIDNSKFKRLVLVDEAHIGGSSDEGKYYELRKNLNKRNSFLFEYSATFHNVKDKNYENSIIFDYSYPKFYKDGYGKDFYLDTIGKDIDNNPQKNLNRSLLILQEKINSYMNYRTFKDQKTLTEFKHQDKPLIAFMGNTVFSDNSKDENTSDIKEILNYLANLSIDEKKNFSFVFNNEYVGNLKLTRNKTVSDEILLSYGNGKFFGILNIGGGEKFLRELEIENVIIETANLVDDKFKFINIDDRESPINILIGSRKFTEGWNSFRLSIINLLNIGKGKGNTIIQVFGRGVRLRGLKGDGKRYFKEADKKSILSWDELSSIEDEDEKNLKKLQTLVITSFDKTYLQTFTNEIHNEIKYYSYFNIPVQPQIINLKSKKLKFEEYSKKLPIFKLSKIQVNNKVIEINNNSISYNNREIEKFKFNLDYRLDKEKSVKENCINRLIELNNKYYNYLSSSL
ncbi:MAG: DEAD/DEAH box helicase family protein, partial [Candidatus Woesearchaeota archaeon]